MKIPEKKNCRVGVVIGCLNSYIVQIDKEENDITTRFYKFCMNEMMVVQKFAYKIRIRTFLKPKKWSSSCLKYAFGSMLVQKNILDVAYLR